MAKYAQGYARKNSDTKNLIILFSSIIAVIVITIVLVVCYNKFWKKEAPTYASEQYSAYYLSSYSSLLDQTEGDYLIYVCSKTSTTDENQSAVLSYLDSYIAGNTTVKLYLIDYDAFDSTSDTTESSYATTIRTELGLDATPTTGYLFAVQSNKLTNQAKQVLTEAKNVQEKLELLEKNGEWLNFNK